MFCKYFHSEGGLSFHLLNAVWSKNIFNLVEIQFISFFPYGFSFWHCIKELCPIWNKYIASPMPSFRGFIVLTLESKTFFFFFWPHHGACGILNQGLNSHPLHWRHSFCKILAFFIGEGNGIPLQHSCLGNPMDGGAW